MKFLFEKFDILAQALGGVKKLREMILQFAVQGKLLPQVPNDEPASILLEKIKSEKERLIKEGKIKKQKPLEPIKENEMPFDLPKGWVLCRIRSISRDWGQKKPDSNFTYIDVTSINKEKGVISENIQLLDANTAPSRARKIVKEGTVIYSTVRPYLLNIAIIEKKYSTEPIASTAFAIIHPLCGVQNFYLYYYFRSKQFIDYVESKMIGMAYPAINDANFFKGLVPLPPLAEQKRIVAKVDSLMALCDDLEKQQKKKAEKKLALNKASLHALNKPNTKQDFNKNWDHITKNFNLLYSTPENVNDLKQTILQLAVQGKLVPQYLNDEPANVLLEKIKAEKERLVKEGKIKKQKPLEPIREDEIPYEIPKGWIWCKLGTVMYIFAGNSFKSSAFNNSTGVKCIKITNAGVGKFIETNDYLPINYIQDYKDYIVNKGDLILALTRPYIATGLKVSVCPTLYDGALLNQRVCAIKDIMKIGKYIYMYLSSELVLNKFKKRFVNTGLQPNLKMQDVTDLLVPLPPHSTQKRIVAKVDSMMVLCDNLSKNLADKETKSEKMLNAVVNQL